MKGLKKLALATAVASLPFAAQAELKALDDSMMGNVTGQNGITIELEANVDIGEVAYEDEGFLAITDVQIGGSSVDAATGRLDSALDNVKLYVDVVGGSGASGTGAQAIGSAYLAGAAAASGGAITWTNTAADPSNGVAAYEAGMYAGDADGTVDGVEDGDLVIGIRSTNPGELVDYGLRIGAVQLAKSGGTPGDLASTAGTTLVSDLTITGVLGPIDIVIQENQDMMNVNAYLTANGSLNVDFLGTYMDFELHNRRGADTNSLGIGANSVSFANAQVDIGKAQNAAGEDALAFNVNNFSGDLDLNNIRMGNSTAPIIGNVYMTDLSVNAKMTVYGH